MLRSSFLLNSLGRRPVTLNWHEMENIGVYWGIAVSFVCSLGIVLTTKWHGRYTLDGISGVQKIHLVPTPRIGGVAILAGLVAAYAAAHGATRALLGQLLLAGLSAFIFGVAEDITKRVSVRARLLATMASGVCAYVLTGARVTHVDVPGLDALLAVAPMSVMFTAFAVGGVANAVNIIDGSNGLSSGTVSICLAALGLIANGVGDVELARVCFIVCGVTVGFFMVNFPLGKLFLGDGGAYLLGFLLAWLGVMLAYRNPDVSVWAPLLATGYPIFETVFTIWRRVRARSHLGMPDSHHLHSLVKVGIVMRLFPNLRADLRNASVSPFSWVIAAVPAVLAVMFPLSTGVLMLCSLVSFALYLSFYWLVSDASKEHPAPLGKVFRFVELKSEEPLPVRRVS